MRLRHLSLVGDDGAPGRPAAQTSTVIHSLEAQPQRPGELCEVLYLDLADEESQRIETHAAESGLPCQLWLTIAIEAERCLAVIAEQGGLDLKAVENVLGQAADDRGACVDHPIAERLSAYASALLAASPRPAAPRIGRVSVRPALAVASKWASAACRADEELEIWIAEKATLAREPRLEWEAAAAGQGRALEEWAAQAILRRRVSNEPAQALGI